MFWKETENPNLIPAKMHIITGMVINVTEFRVDLFRYKIDWLFSAQVIPLLRDHLMTILSTVEFPAGHP